MNYTLFVASMGLTVPNVILLHLNTFPDNGPACFACSYYLYSRVSLHDVLQASHFIILTTLLGRV